MLRAVEHVRAMRGGAQSHLIRADDNRYYVVKALNNPQHPRVLANEWLVSGIARAIGLSVPPCAVMDISDDFLAATPELTLRFNGRNVPFASGPAFASQVPTPALACSVYDYLPEASLDLVENLHEFAGILALDKWTCQCDGRQVIFCRPTTRCKLHAYFIDQGYCFNAGEWSFPDSPMRGIYGRHAVYAGITSWESFEPWLSRIERFSETKLLKIMATMPLEWHDPKETVELLDTLLGRRSRVRSHIERVRFSSQAPFIHWQDAPVSFPAVQPSLFPQPV